MTAEATRAGALRQRDQPLWLCPFTLPTSANVNVGNNLPNGPHLNIHDAVELLAGDTLLDPSRAQTALCASESYVADFEWQLGYLRANALGHFPALTGYCVKIRRHLVLAATTRAVLCRTAQLVGSRAHRIGGRISSVPPAPHSTKIRLGGA
jgi:hypothetical protein